MKVPAFSQPTEHVPDLDSTYRFDRETTLAILAGFAEFLVHRCGEACLNFLQRNTVLRTLRSGHAWLHVGEI